MPKIRINASEAGVRKNVSSAQKEFLRHCRLRNLSPHTLEYYEENLNYVRRILKLNYADELTKEKVDELIDHELDKGNKVGAINTRIRGLRVFVHFCAERDYMDDFKYPLMKMSQEQKEPYTDPDLEIVQRTIEKNESKKTYKNLTYANMEAFIAAQDGAESAEMKAEYLFHLSRAANGRPAAGSKGDHPPCQILKAAP